MVRSIDKRLVLFLLFYASVLFAMASIGYSVGYGYRYIRTHHALTKHGETVTDPDVAARNDAETAANLRNYNLPNITLSGAPGSGESSVMKLVVSVQINKDDAERMADFEPRILDNIVTYLRRVDIKSVIAEDGWQKLRRDLAEQVREGAEPIKVVDVAINRLIVY